jgi:hypothetical protein
MAPTQRPPLSPRRTLRSPFPALAVASASLGLAALAITTTADARTPSLAEYRYFRSLSIDLVGRLPTRGELNTFESDSFDQDEWIEENLKTGPYAERLRRVYMDALRLQIGSTFQFVPGAVTLRRIDVLDEAGNTVPVYFRRGQRRVDPLTDGSFCFPPDVTGQWYPSNAIPAAWPKGSTAEPKKLTKAILDKYTVEVAPWFLYADYKNATPKDRYTADGWAKRGFTLTKDVDQDANGVPYAKVRVCREEAQKNATGKVLTTGRKSSADSDKIVGRGDRAPVDDSFTQKNPTATIACTSGSAVSRSAECGCGVGLEQCIPSPSYRFNTASLNFPTAAPLGDETTFATGNQGGDSWARYWWGQEAVRFLDDLFVKDNDFRTVLTSKSTWVNGPLAQFYRSSAASSCCGNGTYFGQTAPTPLFDLASIPALLPFDATSWKFVESRGSLSSGILTMPIFLTKYGTRRARAHVLYQAFLCKEFVAENTKLQASDDPNLATRQGCSACHAKLEPLAAYFTRISESGWNYLPKTNFPIDNAVCLRSNPDDPTSAALKGSGCTTFYDPAFSDGKQGELRGAHGSRTNAEKGPAGIAEEMTSGPEFSSCAVQQVAGSFLGRALDDGDAPMRKDLAAAFEKSGFKMSTLVREVVKSRAYRDGNNLSADAWRQEQTP